jgi:vitamin B12 transporter
MRAAGVVNLRTLRGSTAFPSLFYEGDAGTFTSFRNRAQVGGTHKKLDYYGGFDAFQSDNSIKMDEFHDDTASANLGYAFTSATQLRVTARNSDAAPELRAPSTSTALPTPASDRIRISILERRSNTGPIGDWHNLVRYGMTRKREEDINFYAAGIQLTITRTDSRQRTITVTIP